MNEAYLVTPNNVTISKDGKTLIVSKQYADFQGVIEKLKLNDFDGAFELADRALNLSTKSNGVFTVVNGVVYRDGLPVHNVVSDRIREFQETGLPYEPLVKFLENLMSNPSERAISELYKFLENKHLPITEDGHFLAYKSVLGDYMSVTSGSRPARVSNDGGKSWKIYTGHLPNNIGNIIEMDRSDVDDNPNQECSFGLHTGSIDYVNDFSGSKKIIIKVNPRDAVSVPHRDAQKLRVSRYEVVSELISAISEPMVKQVNKEVVITQNEAQPNLQRDMTITLTRSGGWTNRQIGQVMGLITNNARKHLKLRKRLGVFSKVTGSGEIVGTKRMTLNIHLPLDSRYQQPDPAEFHKSWKKAIKDKYAVSKIEVS